MTPSERIALVFGAISGIHEPCGMPHGPHTGCTRDALVAHMKAMILEEREACVVIAESCWNSGVEIARRIRGRMV